MDNLHLILGVLVYALGIPFYVLGICYYLPKVVSDKRLVTGIGIAVGALLALLLGYFAVPYIVPLVAMYPAPTTALLAVAIAIAAYFASARPSRSTGAHLASENQRLATELSQAIERVGRLQNVVDRAPKSVWYREVPQYPLGSQVIELGKMVEAIRLAAVGFLLQAQVAVQTRDKVRANVFLLDYNEAKGGMIGMLWMPPDLQRGQMYQPEENRLRLWPGQGVNGLVFIENRTIIATNPSFNLPRHLHTDVHQELQWIVSFPLDPGLGYPLGMLNIDGLFKVADTDANTREILGKMSEELGNQVAEFARKLAQLPRIVLTLSRASA